ncbi:MAG: polysaccharide deacetylase family protein [Rikenellaceae bacterium]|nr:polysaccharide deacetylase family protein [Rikenellaceae bacterium]
MNILTFDIEEWYHLLDDDSCRNEEQWLTYEVRIHRNVDRILEILEETNTKATFFVIGWIAKQYPEVVKKIADKYEIGSHTMNHQLVWQQNRAEFKDDIVRSVSLLEDITGRPVKYFRAPGFSIRETEAWAFEVIHEAGIEVDCSVFPAAHAHGGIASYGKPVPSIIHYNGIQLKEFPVSVKRIAGKNIIYSGGGYFRLFPYPMIKKWTSESEKYLMSYLHPRDMDGSQPILNDLPATRRFKSYVGIKTCENKLKKWLTDFEFTDIATASNAIDWDKAPVVYLK